MRARRNGRRERGFVLVWFAAAIVTLLAVCALAIDFAHAYFVGQQAQNAADAGALGGVVHLPDDTATATSKALALARDNGFGDGSQNCIAGDTEVCVTPQPDGRQRQLQVEIEQKVDTWFARIIGIDSLRIDRKALAEFDPPIRLGSPSDSFGGIPECPGPAHPCVTAHNEAPGIWAQASGPLSAKENGNAFMQSWCTPTGLPGSALPADSCTSGSDTNPDLDPNGAVFVIDKKTDSAVHLWLYDAVFAPTRDNNQPCNDAEMVYLAGSVPGFQELPRFATGDPPNAYCSGDADVKWKLFPLGAATLEQLRTNIQSGGYGITTTFTVYGPIVNLVNPVANPGPVICTEQYRPFVDFHDPSVTSDPQFRKSFHRWVELTGSDSDVGCGTLIAGVRGKYLVKVTTSGTSGGEGDNAFSMLASTSASGAADTNVSIYALTKMGVDSNIGGSADFYLARVPPSAAGHVLRLAFFDIGDFFAPDPGGSIKVYAMDAVHSTDGSPVGEFVGCTYGNPARSVIGPTDASWPGTPWQTDPPPRPWVSPLVATTSAPAGGPCHVGGISPSGGAHPSIWNAKWVTWDVPVPDDYSCDDTSAIAAQHCWVKISFDWNGGTARDTTTWFATLAELPVRLVQ